MLTGVVFFLTRFLQGLGAHIITHYDTHTVDNLFCQSIAVVDHTWTLCRSMTVVSWVRKVKKIKMNSQEKFTWTLEMRTVFADGGGSVHDF